MSGNNVILIGFMGSGKTTIAKYLSEAHGLELVEMDAQISEREGRNIPEIFAQSGETYFRDLETGLLKELQLRKNMVVSCGGGVPLRIENVSEMKKIGRIVLLEVSPQTVFQRVRNDMERPLLGGRNHLEGIEALMQERKLKYEAASDFVVSADNRTVEDIGEEIVRRLKEMEEQ